MNISEICIKRPVFATVLSLALIVVGLVGFNYLETRFLPKFEQRTIHVTTSYSGASAKLIERSVSTPLEQAISGIAGIDLITSSSAQNSSMLTIKLKHSFDVYQVANQVRNKIEMERYKLPKTIQSPSVRVGWDSSDLMDIGFTSKDQNLNALRDYLERFVIKDLLQIPGVGDISVFGANKYAIRIWLNPNKLAAFNLTAEDVQTAVTNSNIELPAGSIRGEFLNYPVTAETKLQSVKQFNNIIIRDNDGQVVRLKDIGKTVLGSDTVEPSIVRINGKPGIGLSIHPTTDANPIKVADSVQKFLANLQSQLPSGVEGAVVYNQATYMKASVKEVYISILFAIACVALVIFLFLGRLKTMLVPLVTIPICFMAAFAVIYFFGFTINIITLLAIVLSIGLVVDDAIVMLENIYRHVESGMNAVTAAIKGSKEITFAVIAMTITLAAVYAPAALVKTQGAVIFQSFAYTLAGTVIISGFVALTLSPMMCARVLAKTPTAQTGYSAFLERFFTALQASYAKILTSILKFKWAVVIIAILIGVGGAWLMKDLPKAFVPQEDMGFLFTSFKYPTGSNANQLKKNVAVAQDIVQQSSDVAATTSFAGAGFNGVFITLKPYDKRKLGAEKIAAQMNAKLKQVPGLGASVFQPKFGGALQGQLAFSIMTAGSYKDLYKISKNVEKLLKKYPGVHDIKNSINYDSQQYKITINREKAGNQHVSVRSIDSTLAALLGGSDISTFSADGQTYEVYLQAQQSYLHNPEMLRKYYVRSDKGKLVPLGDLINIKPVLAQPSLEHYDRQRAATVYAQLSSGYKLGDTVKYLQTNLPHVLPSNSKYAFKGSAKQLLDSNGSMGFVFLLALIFIYLVLSAQFESFIDPFVILLAVPLAIVSAMATLKLFNGSLNIYTDIGLITLIGLIAKHGILITHFANQLQKQGKSAMEALIEAASIRLRPILMTTFAMIFGALPLVFASGASASSRSEIGLVIISGLLFGTFFSLVVVPVTYVYAAKLKVKVKRKPAVTV